MNRIPQALAGIGMTSMRTRDRLLDRLRERGIENDDVLEVMRLMPRHLFVEEALESRAYEDTALPIGYGQTISQPYTVARMTEVLLSPGTPQRVLEIGTGSGYQCAVLAALCPQVFSVERIEGLYKLARERFRQFRLNNIRQKYTDGGWGWPEHAPFDAIIVTAGAIEVPDALLDQLAEGGRMVIPVGRDGQVLSVIDRHDGELLHTELEPAKFVPLLQGKS